MEKTIDLNRWMAVAVHMHGRLGSLCPTPSEQDLEAAQHDSQIHIDALVRYAQHFSRRRDIIITDTDHPVQIIDRKGLDRNQAFRPENLESTRQVISDGVRDRARIIRSTPLTKNILTGVEADIFSPEGELDVDQSTLSKLDVVLASFHYRIFKAAHNATAPTKDEFMAAYLNVLSNPYVDILAHPLRDIQGNVLAQLTDRDWSQIADQLLKNRSAFEISLYGWRPFAVSDPKKVAEKRVIKQLAEKGVQFSLGLDFHDFQEYGCLPEFEQLVTLDNVYSVFLENCTSGRHRRLLKRILMTIRELQTLGVSDRQVINSDPQEFQNWLSLRRFNL